MLDTPDECWRCGSTLGYMEYTFVELVAVVEATYGPTEVWQKDALTEGWIDGHRRIRDEKAEPRLEVTEDPIRVEL